MTKKKTVTLRWSGGYVTDHILGHKWDPGQEREMEEQIAALYLTHTGWTRVDEQGGGKPKVESAGTATESVSESVAEEEEEDGN